MPILWPKKGPFIFLSRSVRNLILIEALEKYWQITRKRQGCPSQYPLINYGTSYLHGSKNKELMMLSFNPILAMKADNPLKYTQNFPSPMPNLSTKVLLRGFQFKSGFLQVAPNRTNLHTGPLSISMPNLLKVANLSPRSSTYALPRRYTSDLPWSFKGPSCSNINRIVFIYVSYLYNTF